VNKGKAAKVDQAHKEQQEETIGVATREADGTYVLQLRATSSSGAIGQSLMRYKRGDKGYDEVARHVGSIPVGKWVPVKPFPE
jgi:hypothetical protein